MRVSEDRGALVPISTKLPFTTPSWTNFTDVCRVHVDMDRDARSLNRRSRGHLIHELLLLIVAEAIPCASIHVPSRRCWADAPTRFREWAQRVKDLISVSGDASFGWCLAFLPFGEARGHHECDC